MLQPQFPLRVGATVAAYPATTQGKPTHYASLLSTRDSFHRAPPFYAETRMKLSAHPDAFPAFWTFGRDREPYPGNDTAKEFENDVMETFGSAVGYQATRHWHTAVGGPYLSDGGRTAAAGVDLSAAFHTYGTLVTETETVCYFDNAEVGRAAHPVGANVAGQRHFMILDLSFGLPWTGTIHQDTECSVDIDWVRAYAPA